MTDFTHEWITSRGGLIAAFSEPFRGMPQDRVGLSILATNDLPRALAALEAVLDEHPRYEGDFSDFCGHCQARGEGVWPCPTVTAIHAALRGES